MRKQINVGFIDLFPGIDLMFGGILQPVKSQWHLRVLKTIQQKKKEKEKGKKEYITKFFNPALNAPFSYTG